MEKVHNLADVTAPGSDLASLPPHLAPILLQGAPDTTSAFGQLLVCLMSEVTILQQYPTSVTYFDGIPLE